jgi:hypothetical protein
MLWLLGKFGGIFSTAAADEILLNGTDKFGLRTGPASQQLIYGV